MAALRGVILYIWTYPLSELLDWLWRFPAEISQFSSESGGSSSLSVDNSAGQVEALHDKTSRFSAVHSLSNGEPQAAYS